MPQGNQTFFKTTNETVERYALLSKYFDGTEYISGIYEKLGHLKCGLKNKSFWGSEPKRIAKVKITIEELETIKLEEE